MCNEYTCLIAERRLRGSYLIGCSGAIASQHESPLMRTSGLWRCLIKSAARRRTAHCLKLSSIEKAIGTASGRSATVADRPRAAIGTNSLVTERLSVFELRAEHSVPEKTSIDQPKMNSDLLPKALCILIFPLCREREERRSSICRLK